MEGKMTMHEFTKEEWKLVRIHGRTSANNPTTLFYSGSAVECNVRAATLRLTCNAVYDCFEQWITIVLNGAIVSRQMLEKGKQTITVFRGMNPDKIKNVRIIKETEAIPEDSVHYLQILSLETDGEVCPVQKRSLTLEFVGDSITTGEGTYGAKGEEDWIPMFFSAYHNYAYLTAKELCADYRVISKGGWGIYCGWDNNIYNSIPRVYGKVCGMLTGAQHEAVGAQEDYNFAANPVDAVIFHLGTNDYSAFTQEPFIDPETGVAYRQKMNEDGTFEEESEARFVCAALCALRDIREKNPKAYILWVYGMLGNGLEPLIEKALARYRKESGDERISYLALPNTTDDTVGSRYHPGYPSHQAAARVLVERLRHIFRLAPGDAAYQ